MRFVVLEHLCLPNRGFRFFTTNSDDNTRLYSGEIGQPICYGIDGQYHNPEKSIINYAER